MDDSTCTILSLPLELRQQIYELCLSNTSEPEFGLLGVNRSIRHESLHVLEKLQTMFSFNIAGRAAGFDRFTQWCFKLKGRILDLSEMGHITLNIYPPNQIWPIEMWYILLDVQRFCHKLKTHSRIHQLNQLTINFIENENSGWSSDGVENNTMGLPYGPGSRCGSDVGQILAIFARLVNNVGDAAINLPDCHKTSSSDYERWAKVTECVMTGKATDRIDNISSNDFRTLEDRVYIASIRLTRATGLQSKAVFRRMFGQVAVLSLEDYEKFKLHFPCMKDLDEDECPQDWPVACPMRASVLGCRACDSAGKTLYEIELPDPAPRLELGSIRARQWQASTVKEERARCPMDRVHEYVPLPINLPGWCHGEKLKFGSFPSDIPDFDGEAHRCV